MTVDPMKSQSNVDMADFDKSTDNILLDNSTNMMKMWDMRMRKAPVDDLFELTNVVTYNSGFDDMFMEPAHLEKTNSNIRGCLGYIPRRFYSLVFNVLQAVVYYALALAFGGIFAAVWGIVFGVRNFFMVWMVQPSLQLLNATYRIGYAIVRPGIRLFCDPFTESCSIAWSRIRGSINVNVHGVSPRALEEASRRL